MTISVTPGSGKSIASDLIGTGTAPAIGQDVGYSKLDQGPTGSSSPVRQGNGLYIQDDYQAPVNLTINSSTNVNSAVTVATSGYDTVIVSHIVSGTVTGGNTAFEVYDGTSWIAIKGGLISNYGTATNYNLNGGNNCYQFNVAGFPQFRTRLTSALVGSGSVNVAVIVSSAPDVPLMTVGLDPAATVPLPSGAAQETGNLATIATAQGAGGTGISQPTGGSGVLGWLSGIYSKISGTLTVSGSVNVGNTVPVTGTFWQTTQPVSASSLPLPTGAAQESGNLATLAGAVTAGKVQANITNSSIPVTGTFYQTTQPVSGTITANAGTNLNTSLLAVETGGNLATIAGAVSAGKIQANITNSSLAVTGTFYQATQPVSLASLPGLAAGSNTIGAVTSTTATSGGATAYFYHPTGASNQDSTSVKASAATLYGIQVSNNSSTAAYLKLYNKASGPTSSDTPIKVIPIPANSTAANLAGTVSNFGPQGVAFGTGLAFRVSTGIADNDATAVVSGAILINMDYA